jgi:alpha-ketoglutarate-dependent 2,4-dichlorophenoxyacetate dioxygenase
MTLALKPLHSLFAAEASGLDLRNPLTEGEIEKIEKAMDRYAVLVWHGQPLSQDEQVAFAKQFGTLDLGLRKAYGGGAHRLKHPELIDISNVTADGEIAGKAHSKTISNLANQLWHSDSSFQKPAAKYSMLCAVVLPGKGGETEFCDLRAAYDCLPGELKRSIENLSSEHNAFYTRQWLGDTYTDTQLKTLPPVVWPLVRTHPGSGRKLLWVGAHQTHVVGWSLAEGRILLSDLLEHATQRELVHRHAWRVGDLVMWDNRCVLHRGRRFDLSQRRELRRTSTEDVA